EYGIKSEFTCSGDGTEFLLVEGGTVQNIVNQIRKNAFEITDDTNLKYNYDVTLQKILQVEFERERVRKDKSPEDVEKKLRGLKGDIERFLEFLEKKTLRNYLDGLTRKLTSSYHDDINYTKYYPDKSMLFNMGLTLDDRRPPKKIILKSTLEPCTLVEDHYHFKTPFRCFPGERYPGGSMAYEMVLQALIDGTTVEKMHNLLIKESDVPQVHYTSSNKPEHSSFYIELANPTVKNREECVKSFHSFISDLEKNKEIIEEATLYTLCGLTVKLKIEDIDNHLREEESQIKQELEKLRQYASILEPYLTKKITIPPMKNITLPPVKSLNDWINIPFLYADKLLSTVTLSPESSKLKDYLMRVK
ncbi:MAG: hypothetical protein NTW30_04755, partial [Candidatus Aenigmarchaeota archaeon]|nr:hypothetical protein [Candidatus Aenigmarchaeota archaeon]